MYLKQWMFGKPYCDSILTNVGIVVIGYAHPKTGQFIGSLLTRHSFDMGEYQSIGLNISNVVLHHRLENAQSWISSTFGLMYSKVAFCNAISSPMVSLSDFKMCSWRKRPCQLKEREELKDWVVYLWSRFVVMEACPDLFAWRKGVEQMEDLFVTSLCSINQRQKF